jgi:2-keto-4-pentenoate hydratase
MNESRQYDLRRQSMSRLAEQLVRARAEARVVDARVANGVVGTVADAYLIQDQLASMLGGDVRGWKVTALTAEQQRGYSTDKPIAGPLLAPFFHKTPASLSSQQFIAPLLECEIAFLLGKDLPPRGTPYQRAEIEAAVEAIVPAIEIADCRWPGDAPGLLKLADDMGNGAFVAGHAISDWVCVDLGAQDVVFTFEGSEAARGPCARILGDPLLAVLALANAQPLPAGGLKSGQIITTGTCIEPIPMRAGSYVADFGPLGKLSLSVN